MTSFSSIEYNRERLLALPNVSLDETLTIPAESLATFRLNNRHGDVQIIGKDTDVIEVAYSITVFADSEEMAIKYLSELTLNQTEPPEQLDLSVQQPAKPLTVRSVRTNFIVYLPHSLHVLLESNHGETVLENLHAGVEVTLQHGRDLQVRNISEEANFDVSHSSGEIQDLKGNLVLSSTHSQLSLDRVQGCLDLSARHSNLDIQDVAGNVNFVAGHDQINFRRVAGFLQGASSHSDICATGLESDIDISGRYGTVRLLDTTGSIIVSGRHTLIDVELRDVAKGYTVLLRTDRANVNSNLELDVSETDRNRKTHVGVVKAGQHNVRVKAEYGSIHLNL